MSTEVTAHCRIIKMKYGALIALFLLYRSNIDEKTDRSKANLLRIRKLFPTIWCFLVSPRQPNKRVRFFFFSFSAAVKCKAYDPPINGLVSCTFQNAYGGDLCTPSCVIEKEFARIPAQFYVCFNTGSWVVFDNRPYVSQEMPWPDCTGM